MADNIQLAQPLLSRSQGDLEYILIKPRVAQGIRYFVKELVYLFFGSRLSCRYNDSLTTYWLCCNPWWGVATVRRRQLQANRTLFIMKEQPSLSYQDRVLNVIYYEGAKLECTLSQHKRKTSPECTLYRE